MVDGAPHTPPAQESVALTGPPRRAPDLYVSDAYLSLPLESR